MFIAVSGFLSNCGIFIDIKDPSRYTIYPFVDILLNIVYNDKIYKLNNIYFGNSKIGKGDFMVTAKILLAYLLTSAGTTDTNVDISSIDIEEAYCMAENIYFESRSEDVRGQIAVGLVTMNRVNNDRYPDTVCDVVKQTAINKHTKKPVCAFSWYCENKKTGRTIQVLNKDGTRNERVIDQFEESALIAIKVLSGKLKDSTNGATHFFNPNKVQPAWANEMIKTLRVGNHDFYRPRK